jgi:aprataxin and PNK-like factor
VEKIDSNVEQKLPAKEETSGNSEPTVVENRAGETNSEIPKEELGESEDGTPAKKPKVEVEKIDAPEGLVPVLPSTAAQVPFAGSAEQNKAEAEAEAETEAKKPRAPCQYGASCYRKNPIHFQDFSHPGESDYITPAVPPQPVKPPAPQRQKTGQQKTESGRPMRKAAARRVKASVLAGGDSDEDEESFDENDAFNDDEEFLESSESEEDTGGRDSDDDWMPDDEEEDDDLKDLVIEADDYVPGGRKPRSRARRY